MCSPGKYQCITLIKMCSPGKYRCFSRLWQQGPNFNPQIKAANARVKYVAHRASCFKLDDSWNCCAEARRAEALLVYASINLTGYHPPPPPPPRLTAGQLIFSVKIPAPGTAFQCKTPGPGSEKTKQNPHPRA